jgi:hypothetical protein
MATEPPPSPETVPSGYREAYVAAVAVVLGFTLVYLKFVVFDQESGDWSLVGGIAAGFGVLSCIGQFYSLWRGLQVADNRAAVYNVTVRVFAVSIVLFGISAAILLIAFNIY